MKQIFISLSELQIIQECVQITAMRGLGPNIQTTRQLSYKLKQLEAEFGLAITADPSKEEATAA
jgi:hypothetical protein